MKLLMRIVFLGAVAGIAAITTAWAMQWAATGSGPELPRPIVLGAIDLMPTTTLGLEPSSIEVRPDPELLTDRDGSDIVPIPPSTAPPSTAPPSTAPPTTTPATTRPPATTTAPSPTAPPPAPNDDDDDDIEGDDVDGDDIDGQDDNDDDGDD